MSWQKHFSEKCLDILRALPAGAMLFNAILIAAGSVYVVAKVVIWTLHWINARIFSGWWD